ncbi:hypothetical protein IFM12275_03410 [Nocardia sputorum]|uniref:Uncharacterized protein n=1 Tax=Nocardia sputorum TaxID=2984338 RepID=A0ABN6U2Y3_9NOCA|nr:hypothetical protein IFM12275_03410 [Nocardia sputorum]BDT98984.1 hypothetical protein IFM12276_20130 [Nocardia sputorum]
MAGQVNCTGSKIDLPSGGEENPVQSAGPPEGMANYRKPDRQSRRWSLNSSSQMPCPGLPGAVPDVGSTGRPTET